MHDLNAEVSGILIGFEQQAIVVQTEAFSPEGDLVSGATLLGSIPI